MSVITKLIEKAQDRIIEVVFTLIATLALIVWQAIPAEVWKRISAYVPNRVLWALLALAAIVAILEGTYIIHLRRKLNPKLTLSFGVYWDNEHNLYCPKDKTLLYQSQVGGVALDLYPDEFTCIQCGRTFTLNNGSFTIDFKDAKKRLLSN